MTLKSFLGMCFKSKDALGLITLRKAIGKEGYNVEIINLDDKNKIMMRPKDLNILREVWYDKCYNPKGFELKENDVVVDIGAHIGIFSIIASNIVGNNGVVYSFEPERENYDLLCLNSGINYTLFNIKQYNQAISNKNGKVRLNISNEPSNHSIINDDLSKIPYQIVDSIKLSTFIKDEKIKNIDFLKIDCEGAEYLILKTLTKSDWKKIRKIAMEVHNAIDSITSLLLENEFMVTKVKDQDRFMVYARRLR